MYFVKKYVFLIFFAKKKGNWEVLSYIINRGCFFMAGISSEKINEIRNSVDIVDVISSYVQLIPKGANFFGVCPFHDDNNPSMSVSGKKQIYTCFSCHATGNVFKFIMDYENISFLEAVKKVAEIGHVNVDINTSAYRKTNNKLLDIYDFSLKIYTNNLNTSEGNDAKAYLKERQIDEETIKKFDIGLSLQKKDILSNILLKKFAEPDILKSGLVQKNEYGYVDLYYNRIMFPLYNLNGQVVGYSGRIYHGEENSSKYINTKETEIFHKGELLYNYHRAKEFARTKNTIIVMEGFMDVIRADTVGINNVIATMGTAVTPKQANLIKRMASNIVLCFDGDQPGQKAAMGCSDELLKLGVAPKIVVLEDNLDPDEYILKHGKEKFIEKINNPFSLSDFKLNYLKQNLDFDNENDIANYANKAIEEINKLEDDILRELTIKKLAKETGLDESFIKSKVVEPEKKESKLIFKKTEKKSKNISKYQKAEQSLLFYMLFSPEVIKIYNKKITYMPTSSYRKLAREISLFYKEKGHINIADLFDYCVDDEEVISAIGEINNLNLSEDYTIKQIEDYINVIREYNVKNETKRLLELMKKETSTTKKAEIAQKIIDLKKGE